VVLVGRKIKYVENEVEVKNTPKRLAIPDEMSTEQLLKFSDKIPCQQWEDWLEVKWQRVK